MIRCSADLNNVFVSSTNHRLDPREYLAGFPIQAVREIHLGGHSETVDEAGAPLLIDSHDSPVKEPVWKLYQEVIERTGSVASLVEWDNDVPEWSVLRREAKAVQDIFDDFAKSAAA